VGGSDRLTKFGDEFAGFAHPVFVVVGVDRGSCIADQHVFFETFFGEKQSERDVGFDFFFQESDGHAFGFIHVSHLRNATPAPANCGTPATCKKKWTRGRR
jgi:hypothetical protein